MTACWGPMNCWVGRLSGTPTKFASKTNNFSTKFSERRRRLPSGLPCRTRETPAKAGDNNNLSYTLITTKQIVSCRYEYLKLEVRNFKQQTNSQVYILKKFGNSFSLPSSLTNLKHLNQTMSNVPNLTVAEE